MIRLFSLVFLALATAGLPACVGTDELTDTVLRIEVSAPETKVEVGKSVSLSAKLVNTFGDKFGGPVEWVSEDPGVATISASGILLGISPGQVAIRATNDSLISEELLITVFTDVSQPASVVVTGNVNILEPGTTLQLTAFVRDASGNVLIGTAINWESAHPAIATVDAQGKVTAVSAGNTSITARVGDIRSQAFVLMVGSSVVRAGTFKSENGHSVSGGVELSGSPAGVVINFKENFQTQSGPGLYVYLSNSPNSVSGAVEIGQLRKRSGADTYSTPQGVTMDSYNYVLVHCKPFNVTFGSAKLP